MAYRIEEYDSQGKFLICEIYDTLNEIKDFRRAHLNRNPNHIIKAYKCNSQGNSYIHKEVMLD